MKRTGLASRIVLLLCSTVFSLLLAEFSYRFYLFGWDTLSTEKANSNRVLADSGLQTPASCPEMIYELKPNVRTIFKMVPFETNSAGLRDEEYELSSSPQVFRTAVIGDSLTMGSGVRIERTFHFLLEEMLNEEQARHAFEFINFGVGGYTLRQYLGVLNCKAKEYNPDLVLIGFYPGNDHRILSNERFEEPYLPAEKKSPFVSSFLLEKLFRVRANWGLKPEGPTQKEIDYMSDMFLQFGNYSKVHGVPVAVVYLTYRTDHLVRPHLVKNLTESSGLYFVDVSRAFDQDGIEKYRIYPTDNHPNALANRIFAGQIYEYLTAKALLETPKVRGHHADRAFSAQEIQSQ